MTTEFIISGTDKIIGKTLSRGRAGFKHVVEYYRHGHLLESRSVGYINRTWESYKYETAIKELLGKMGIPFSEQATILESCRNQASLRTNQMFGSVASVAQLGEAMGGQTTKEKNDWKVRMLKAGLGGYGLEMPADWDTLSETEKERRLNLVIKQLKG
jgi:hypothetical protein